MSEFSIPAGKYGPLAHALLDRADRERLPLVGALELTQRCNLACVHCYVNLAPGDGRAKATELKTDEVCRILDEVAEAGNLWLTITGGEPLLRPDFAEIYRHAWRAGLLVTLYTNGTMITPRVIELFEKHPPYRIEITQYGYTAEVYDQVTDVEGAYRRFDRGIQLLARTRLPWALKAMALKQNGHEIMRIKERAQSFGVEFRFDSMINPRIDGGRGPLEHRLSPAEVAALDIADHERYEGWRDYCAPRWGKIDSDRKYQCGAAHSTFLIDPYGRLHACELSRRPGYDLRTGRFREGWFEVLPRLREEKRDTTRGCGTCTAHSVCGQCPGFAELERKSVEEPNLYLCQVSAERARVLGAPPSVQPAGLIQLRRQSEPRVRAAELSPSDRLEVAPEPAPASTSGEPSMQGGPR